MLLKKWFIYCWPVLPETVGIERLGSKNALVTFRFLTQDPITVTHTVPRGATGDALLLCAKIRSIAKYQNTLDLGHAVLALQHRLLRCYFRGKLLAAQLQCAPRKESRLAKFPSSQSTCCLDCLNSVLFPRRENRLKLA